MFGILAKFEEEDSMIPKLTDLPSFVNEETTKEDFVYLEFYVLESFNWFVGFTTSAHFAEYYSLFAVVKGDSDHFETSHRHLQDLVQSSLRDFLDISLTGNIVFSNNVGFYICVFINNQNEIWIYKWAYHVLI